MPPTAAALDWVLSDGAQAVWDNNGLQARAPRSDTWALPPRPCSGAHVSRLAWQGPLQRPGSRRVCLTILT